MNIILIEILLVLNSVQILFITNVFSSITARELKIQSYFSQKTLDMDKDIVLTNKR